MRRHCKECGQEKTSTGLFCRSCREIRKEARKMVAVVPCFVCGQPVECRDGNPWRSSLAQAKAGRACCSPECVQEAKRQTRIKSGESLAQYNRTKGRMDKIVNNPMKDPKTLAKMLATKRGNGTLSRRPVIQGGNGRPVPIAQKLLADALKWQVEVPVKTSDHLPKGKRRAYLAKLKLPTCYKIDIANPELMVGVEVDGATHNGSRRSLDAKKTECLRELGWRLLRLSNRQIQSDLAGCVRTVMSII